MKTTNKIPDSLATRLKTINKKNSRYQQPKIDINLSWKYLQLFGKAHIKNFVIDKNNKPAYTQLFAYFLRIEDKFDGDLDKGLMLLGNYGTGKSKAMRIFKDFIEYYFLHMQPFNIGFNIKDVTQIVGEYKHDKDGGEKSISKYKGKSAWCFDDFGKDMKDDNYASHWGNRVNVLEQIIASRYVHMQNYGTLTHCTTNYPVKGKNGTEFFKEFYGDYINDRIPEMFNIIKFKGSSRRK